MLRARRLASVVSVAVVGVLALGACGRAAPDVAAYVDDTRYRTDRVDTIYSDAQARYGAAVQAQAAAQGVPTPSPDQLKSTLTRQEIVDLLVSLDLGKRVAAEKRIQVPDKVNADQVAQVLRMPADAEYAKLWSEWADVYQTLGAQLPPVQVSDASVDAVYRALVRGGKVGSNADEAQIRGALSKEEFVQLDTTVSAAMTEMARRVGVTINPRYRPLGLPALFPTQNGFGFYSLPYIDQNGPVTDLAPTAAPETPAA
jgi:hypothetical protein